MKVTFEGDTLRSVLLQMEDMLAVTSLKIIPKPVSENPKKTALPLDELFGPGGPGPEETQAAAPVDKPVDKPVDSPEKKAAAADKMAKLRAAKEAKKAAKAAAAAPAEAPPAKPPEPSTPKAAKGQATSQTMDPAEIVKIRAKTIEDLQTAYANGHQKEVFELLSRFGNGAKSFRELQPDAFVPIREAIDNGALT